MDYLYILREALVWLITIFWLYQIMVSLCSLVKIKDKPLKVNKNHKQEQLYMKDLTKLRKQRVMH